MADFNVVFRGPGGVRQGTFSGATIDAVRKQLTSAGFEPLGYAQPQAPPPGAAGGAAAGQQIAAMGSRPGPGIGTDVASTGLQIGVPAALAAARMLPGGRYVAPAIGIGAGLLPYMAQRGGLPSAGEAGSVVAGEALPSLGALRRAPQAALEAGGKAVEAARGFGPIMRSPLEFADRVIDDAQKIFRGAEPEMQQTLKHSLGKLDIDITKMKRDQFLSILRSQPERIRAAANALKAASSREVLSEPDLMRLWASTIIHGKGASELAPAGAKMARGLLTGEAGGNLLLNGKAFADAWSGLDPLNKAVFGTRNAQAMEGFVRAIDKLKAAPKGYRLLTAAGDQASKEGKIALFPQLAAVKRVIQNHPAYSMLGGSLGLGALAESGAARGLMANPMLGAAAAAPIAAQATIQLGKRASAKLIERIMSTPAGIEWMTRGIEMSGRAMPSVMIADTLSRSLAKSPEILMSLGLTSGPGGTNAAPTASPAQPGPGVGFSLPGGGS